MAACLISATALCLSNTATGQEVAEIPFNNAPTGSAALGGGIRFGQNQYFDSQNEDERTFDLIPLYLYEGKWLFARGTMGGVHFVNNDNWELSAIAKWRFQDLNPDSNEFYEGLEERDQTLDAGLQVISTREWGELRLSWVTDTLDNHNGQEVQFTYRYRFHAGPWSLSPYVTVAWQDENLTNYYYGVSESEATPERLAYDTGESQWLGVGLNTAWQMTDRITWFANIGFGGADSSIANSPLTQEEGYSQAFVGGTYTFGNAIKPDYIIDSERRGEWSWRVNYGYQADGNIISEIDQGDFSKSTIADTNIAGLTLSRLLADGDRIDFLGKVAMFRHYEKDEGNENFWSWAAYILVQGTGYSPWSKKELFRLGFGFGMSYAQNIPIAEQLKQTGEGAAGNSSNFLNYLELSVDFPLKRASKANWLQKCYAGLTVVHRSGIFGTSDILGDVSGGSDWITAHLECKV